MKLFDKVFHKSKKEPVTQELRDQAGMAEPEGEIQLSREDIDVFDKEQRKQFIDSCLEQMAEAVSEMEDLKGEYELVNAYLTDVDAVEKIKGDERTRLEEHAASIAMLALDTKQYKGKQHVMSDKEYGKMARLKDVAEEGILKIREAETYQEAVRQDLQRLEGEKHACQYRKHEAGIGLMNMKGMATICVCAVFACIVLLMFLQFALSMDAKAGYLITAAAAAVTLTVIYVKYMENSQELQRASASLNKVILLQNKVKIRYVNNTNLLDYLYAKYETTSGKELERLRSQYVKERTEREKMRQAEEELEFHEQKLVELLKEYQLFDPLIWIHQTEAVLDKKEMVEVRHNLIVRRQNLRKQMEYNSGLAECASAELKKLAADYPEFSGEILQKVSVYEKKCKSKLTD